MVVRQRLLDIIQLFLKYLSLSLRPTTPWWTVWRGGRDLMQPLLCSVQSLTCSLFWYDLIGNSREEHFNRILMIWKCAQWELGGGGGDSGKSFGGWDWQEVLIAFNMGLILNFTFTVHYQYSTLLYSHTFGWDCLFFFQLFSFFPSISAWCQNVFMHPNQRDSLPPWSQHAASYHSHILTVEIVLSI